ncbi:hypothetical protein Tco_0324407 [Tanacetum coccineum]
MVNQGQNTTQQEQPFIAAKQVGFNLVDIILNTNNKVALLYPEHANKETFKCVSDFISKCCLKEQFTRSPHMYKEYLTEFWYSAKALKNSKVSFSIPTGGIYGEVGVNTFMNAIGAHYLPHSSEYVAPPSIDIVKPWFETIRYGKIVLVKGTLKKSLLPPREKVVPYTRFLSLLMMHKMKEGYGDGEVTLYPTQLFNVNKWALKAKQPEGPPFTYHMLVICSTAKPVVLKASKPSSNAKRVSQGTKPGAQPGHKKHSTFSKQPSVSSRDATKGRSFKAPTGSKTGHLKRKKESSLTIDSNPSQTSAFTYVVTEMHKEDQQATGSPNSLGVANEERADPQLCSGMSTFNLNKPIYLASFIIYSESTSGNDILADSITEADLGKLLLVLTRMFLQTKPNLLVKEASRTIKLEDLAKLVQNVQPSFKDLNSPEDDPIIVVDDSDEDKKDDKGEEVHTISNVETKDAYVLNPPSPRIDIP